MTLALVQQVVIGLNLEAITEWSAYRAEDLKKPLTPRARKMVERKLMQHSESEQMRLVELAIENNWRGIYYQEPQKMPAQSSRDRSIADELTDTLWAR